MFLTENEKKVWSETQRAFIGHDGRHHTRRFRQRKANRDHTQHLSDIRSVRVGKEVRWFNLLETEADAYWAAKRAAFGL